MLSSFAKPDKTNEQTKRSTVVPLEVPHDTRICIEDLVDTNFDESDVDELRDEKKAKQSRAGTQEPVKKQTARRWDPRALERKEQCQLQAVTCESDVAEETMSATVKIAKEIDEPDIGQLSAE